MFWTICGWYSFLSINYICWFLKIHSKYLKTIVQMRKIQKVSGKMDLKDVYFGANCFENHAFERKKKRGVFCLLAHSSNVTWGGLKPGASNLNSGLPHGWQVPRFLSHLEMPSMVSFSRKLELEVQRGLEPLHSPMGCICSKLCPNYRTNACHRHVVFFWGGRVGK